MRWLLALLLFSVLSTASSAETLTVVVNGDTEVGSVDKQRMRRILLGRITTWSDGTPITIVLVDDPACEQALQAICDRGHRRLLQGWQRLVYTGNGAMPLVADDLTQGLARVRQTAGAVLVISGTPADATGVQVMPISHRYESPAETAVTRAVVARRSDQR